MTVSFSFAERPRKMMELHSSGSITSVSALPAPSSTRLSSRKVRPYLTYFVVVLDLCLVTENTSTICTLAQSNVFLTPTKVSSHTSSHFSYVFLIYSDARLQPPRLVSYGTLGNLLEKCGLPLSMVLLLLSDCLSRALFPSRPQGCKRQAQRAARRA